MKLKYVLFLSVFLLFSSNGLAVFPHVEEWNSGSTAGWTGNTVVSTVVHIGAGGNPDGYIETRGTGNGSFDVGASTDIVDFTGDYAVAGITGASVDLIFKNGPFDAAWIRFRYLDATQNGWLHPLTNTFTPNVWQTYSVNFDPTWSDIEARNAGWITDHDVYPSSDPSASFAATMADVYTAEVRISGEGDMLAGIDNFAVVPEPTTLLILGLGGMFLRSKKF